MVESAAQGADPKGPALLVLGAGLGRTGTSSLREALNQLGFGPTYHMVDVFRNRDHPQLWRKALEGGELDIDRIFSAGGYRSAVDVPASLFYKQLMERFSEAKVVLTVRNEVSWWRSVSRTVHLSSQRKYRGRVVLFRLMPQLRSFDRLLKSIKMVTLDEWEARAHFRDHMEEVKATVPADKLLVFRVEEGWEPLCRFLGVPVPTAATPAPTNTGTEKPNLPRKLQPESKSKAPESTVAPAPAPAPGPAPPVQTTVATRPIPFPHVNDTESINRMLQCQGQAGWVLGFGLLMVTQALLNVALATSAALTGWPAGGAARWARTAAWGMLIAVCAGATALAVLTFGAAAHLRAGHGGVWDAGTDRSLGSPGRRKTKTN